MCSEAISKEGHYAQALVFCETLKILLSVAAPSTSLAGENSVSGYCPFSAVPYGWQWQARTTHAHAVS